MTKNQPQSLPSKYSLDWGVRGVKQNEIPVTLKLRLPEGLLKFCGAAAEVSSEGFTKEGIWAECLSKEKQGAEGMEAQHSVSRVCGNTPSSLVDMHRYRRVGR